MWQSSLHRCKYFPTVLLLDIIKYGILLLIISTFWSRHFSGPLLNPFFQFLLSFSFLLFHFLLLFTFISSPVASPQSPSIQGLFLRLISPSSPILSYFSPKYSEPFLRYLFHHHRNRHDHHHYHRRRRHHHNYRHHHNRHNHRNLSIPYGIDTLFSSICSSQHLTLCFLSANDVLYFSQKPHLRCF